MNWFWKGLINEDLSQIYEICVRLLQPWVRFRQVCLCKSLEKFCQLKKIISFLQNILPSGTISWMTQKWNVLHFIHEVPGSEMNVKHLVRFWWKIFILICCKKMTFVFKLCFQGLIAFKIFVLSESKDIVTFVQICVLSFMPFKML